MRNWLVAGFVLVCGALSAAPSVTEVTARQRYPWNGMVDVSCTASGVVAGKNRTTVTATDLAAGTNVTVATLSVAGAAVENGAFSLAAGANQILWDAQKDLPKDYLSERMKIDVAVIPYSFSVKFNANGGTGTMANESFDYGTAKALTANTFTKSGYTFSGWATTASGAVAYTDRQSVSNLSASDKATVNLYAVWQANTYSVQFNANGGTGTMANEAFTYGTAKALTANVFTRTGYTFQGWATSASGAKVYTDKQSVSNLTATAGATVNLYAAWKANTYSVKFNANGGTGTMANESFTYGTAKALTANAFTKSGYAFSGWATTASGTVAYTDKQSVSNLSATDKATVNLYAVWKQTNPLYMVIDLSAGASATSYPVSYLDAVPSGGWSDTYKTTRLVLRRIKAGSNSAGGRMSKDMWVGVFEVTGKQYYQVKGSFAEEMGGLIKYRPETNPKAAVGCMDNRGSGFLSTLKSKTGVLARLPTSDEWQYACRAGTTTAYNNGTSATSANMSKVGWHSGNISNSSTQPGAVGMFVPNNWGLYDMHGNVYEKVSDFYYVAGGGGTYYCGGGYTSAYGVNPNYNQCTSSSKDGWESKNYFTHSGIRVFAEVK